MGRQRVRGRLGGISPFALLAGLLLLFIVVCCWLLWFFSYLFSLPSFSIRFFFSSLLCSSLRFDSLRFSFSLLFSCLELTAGSKPSTGWHLPPSLSALVFFVVFVSSLSCLYLAFVLPFVMSKVLMLGFLPYLLPRDLGEKAIDQDRRY